MQKIKSAAPDKQLKNGAGKRKLAKNSAAGWLHLGWEVLRDFERGKMVCSISGADKKAMFLSFANGGGSELEICGRRLGNTENLRSTIIECSPVCRVSLCRQKSNIFLIVVFPVLLVFPMQVTLYFPSAAQSPSGGTIQLPPAGRVPAVLRSSR